MPNAVDTQLKNISSQIILSKILIEKNLQGWQLFYDKYAGAMYGCICTLTDDKAMAEEIFKEAFIHLKEKEILSGFNSALLPCLLRYTSKFATERLMQHDLKPKAANLVEENKLIHLLCSSCHSLKEAASILNITEEEARKKLHLEFLAFRDQNKNKEFQNAHQPESGETIHKF